MVTTSHMQLLSTWTEASVAKELNFKFYLLLNLICHVAGDYRIGQSEEPTNVFQQNFLRPVNNGKK